MLSAQRAAASKVRTFCRTRSERRQMSVTVAVESATSASNSDPQATTTWPQNSRTRAALSSPCSMSGVKNFSKVLPTSQSTRVYSGRPVGSPRRHVMGPVVLDSAWSDEGQALIERLSSRTDAAHQAVKLGTLSFVICLATTWQVMSKVDGLRGVRQTV